MIVSLHNLSDEFKSEYCDTVECQYLLYKKISMKWKGGL